MDYHILVGCSVLDNTWYMMGRWCFPQNVIHLIIIISVQVLLREEYISSKIAVDISPFT